MKVNRRNFIQKLGVAAAVPAILPQLVGCNSSSKSGETTQDTTAAKKQFSIDNFGIQLWTVKEDMAKDPKGTLKSLADYGYTQIESFGGQQGIFWGMSPADFKSYLDSIGLSAVSSHCDPAYTVDKSKEDEFKKLAEDAASVGIKYLINPFPGEKLFQKSDWMAVAEGLNRLGEICKSFGIKSGYHNHHYEFKNNNGNFIPEQLLLENTDAALVDFELDLYWVVQAGSNPIKWLTDYKDRYRLVHVKDMYKNDIISGLQASEKSDSDFWPIGMSTFLGNGQIDFKDILPIAQENGVQYFIVEQERFDNSTPLQDAQKDADYMKKFVHA